MSYVDLHLHLLPGVDDGPQDLATSLVHARRMVAHGVTEATVTPHIAHPGFRVAVEEIAERTAGLQGELDAREIGLHLHPGGELHAAGAPALGPAALDAIAQGPRGARWVLLEPSFAGIDAAFSTACDHLRVHGFGVVVAHPERSADVLRSGMRRLRAEITAGAVLQVSVCSLLGLHGWEPKEVARRLIRARLAYLLASDGHGGGRSHTLADGIAPARTAGASEVQAVQLTRANPGFLLRQGIPLAGPDDRARRTFTTW